jgi:8-oxo-dGTP diphosphatase
MKIPKVILAADVVIDLEDGSIVLIKRANDPYKDFWALPGGLVEEDETVENAAVREAKEETGLDVRLTRLLGVFSKPGRDPRGRVVSVAFTAVVTGGTLRADTDAKEVVAAMDYLDRELAFDHREMILKYLDGE